ncbi:MAG TPA: cytochrome P460 family protein [Acidobacteriaceae bacterium]|nr:cytochrome P460 family protein [Acidobacteriaceae bacterium]
MKRLTLGISIAVIAVVTCFFTLPAMSGSAHSEGVLRARFNSNGEVLLPVGYRQWVHVGTRVNPLGQLSILDGKPTTTPEALDAYVEPHAFAAYQRTGKWPDGSQLVKEFSAVRTGAGCQSQTYLCTTEFGEGIFETRYIGLGMMVKDEKRFPSAPGHWGFFSFGHKPPPYDPVSPVRPASRCQNCHVRLASDTDFVISRAHIGMARAQTN